MKKILCILLGLGLAWHSQAQIVFETGTWAEVKAKAKQENKMIFVDAYTTWCGPCKWMAKNTFTDKKVGEYYNANFINYKMDMEAGEGPKFADEFRVEAYPTLLYFNAEGQVAHRTEGSQDANMFLATGKKVQSNPNAVEEVKTEEVLSEESWEGYNNQAWEYYLNESDPDKLQEAVGWVKKSIEMEQNFYNTDTYAHLLYKLNQKQEALKWASLSVKLGKENGADTTETEKLIQQIKTKK
jgi:thiol-disulfide isomerase/thioredoxin